MDDPKKVEDPKVEEETPKVDPNTLGDEANTPEPTDPNSEGEDEAESEDEA